jgi:lysophospholipase L1-like esterase
MSTVPASRARYAIAVAVLLGIGCAVWVTERLVAASDPDLLWRDPVSGDDGLKFYRFDRELGLFHKRSFSAAYQGVEYTTNSLGLRGPEASYARSPGRRRIVLLGDSVVWGFGVPDSQTLAVALEEVWHPTEVLNLGIAGYGTGQELMLLRREGLRYRPDRVLLVFTIANDVEDTYFPDSAASYPANLFHLESGNLRVDRFETTSLEAVGLWLSHNSFLVNYLARIGAHSSGGTAGGGSSESGQPQTQQRAVQRSATGRSNWERLQQGRPDLSRYAQLRYLEPQPDLEPERADGQYAAVHYATRGGLLPPTPLAHYKVELVKQLLLEIARESRAHDADFAVVLAPYAAQLSDDSPSNPLVGELVRFLTEQRIAVVDLLPMLRESRVPPGALYVDSAHFSGRGNRLIADLLAAELPEPAH